MNKIAGVVMVAVGSASYGILATIIKLANNNGLGTASLTFSQYLFGALILSISSLFFSKKPTESIKGETRSKYPKLKLVLFGTSLGLTSSFYYLCIQYVPVSVGIILLMQTVWMGILLEFFIDRRLVNKSKLIGAAAVLIGTLLASRIFESDFNFNFIGFLYGLLAAVCFTIALYSANKVSLQLPDIIRSKYLVFGGFIAVLIFWNIQIIQELNSLELLKWGIVLALFGTVLPPVLFSKGVPIIGNGLTSIIATLEIPVSILSAFFLLREQIGISQTVGIVIILVSIILTNIRKKSNDFKHQNRVKKPIY